MITHVDKLEVGLHLYRKAVLYNSNKENCFLAAADERLTRACDQLISWRSEMVACLRRQVKAALTTDYTTSNTLGRLLDF